MKFIFSFISAVLSFILSILIAMAALFFLGWIARVVLGHETSSQYLQGYVDFYKNPDQTPVGEWLKQSISRIKS